MNTTPITFYWRGRILELHSDDAMNLYSAPVDILRRAMARSSSVTTLDLALKAQLGASYQVTVTDTGARVVVDLKRHGTGGVSPM